MDRAAILAAISARIPAAMRGRPVHASGIRGAMQAVVAWALQSSGDQRLSALLADPSPDLIVRALRAGGWSRQTDVAPLLDDLEGGGAGIVAMYLTGRARAESHARSDAQG